MNAQKLRVLSLFAVLTSWSLALAEEMTFVIDPVRSSVSLSGSASSAPLQPQAAGSLTATYVGTIVLDAGASEIRFPGGSRVQPQEPNSWQPGPGGDTGSAPASYGGKAQIGSGFLSVNALAATRRISFDVLSAPLTLNDGTFSAGALQFQFVATNTPVLDYNARSLLGTQKGSQALEGLATNSLAGMSTLVTAGSVQTLTLSVNASYRFGFLVPEDSVLRLTGQIVATRTNLDVAPVLAIGSISAGATSMTLTWPVGFKLQKSTRLLNPDWKDTGATSPATIPFDLQGEYFQVVGSF